MPILTNLTSTNGGLTVADLLDYKNMYQNSPIATMIPDNPEIIYQPMYDRVNYPETGAKLLNFFSNPRGTNVTLITGGVAGSRSKNFRDTNMDQANVMSSTGFIAMGVTVTYIPLGNSNVATQTSPSLTFEDDKYRIATGSWLEITFVDKPYLRLPLFMIPSAAESRGSKAIALSGTSGSLVTNVMNNLGGYGAGSVREPFVFDPPYLIAPNESYSVTIHSDGTPLNSGNSIDICLALLGYKIRPAQ